MNKLTRFFKLMGYETKRIFRDRMVSFSLLTFAVIMILALFFVQTRGLHYDLAIYTDGLDVSESETMQYVDKFFEVNMIEVSSEEEGIEMVRRDKATFFLAFHKGEEGAEPTAVFYYDESNRYERGMAYDFLNLKDQETYNKLKDYFVELGVTLNDAYFNAFTIKPISGRLKYEQLAFPDEVAVIISLILMLGVAFSVARDRETEVGKNIAYLPIGKHEYLLSKNVPHLILGMFEMLVVCLLGKFLLKINFAMNFFLVWIVSSVFLVATISLAMLCSTLRSQIATVFCSMLTILLPIFVHLLVVIAAIPIGAKIVLYLFPITPFMQLFMGMVYNGVVIWWDIPILLVESVIYYFAAYAVIRKTA